MPTRIISATKAPNGYHFVVLLDDTKMVEDPENPGELRPDPEWLHDVHFGPLQPSPVPLHPKGGHNETGEFLHACTTQHGKNLTEEQYLANITEQLAHQAELELHRRQGGSHHDRHKKAIAHLEGKEISWQ